MRGKIVLLIIFLLIILLPSPVFLSAEEIEEGDLIKCPEFPSVYLVKDGGRYSFPFEKVYTLRYGNDFSQVKIVTSDYLANIDLLGNVLLPNETLVKLTTDPKVYVVKDDKYLEWLPSEQTAIQYFGESWAYLVVDVSDAFFPDYEIRETSYTNEIETAYITDVIDGDTIKTSANESIRLIGINAPESGQYYYLESAKKLEDFILNKTVVLESDVSDTDLYGRLLRYVYVNGLFVNLEMVRQGFATAYEYVPDVKYSDDISAAQNEAQDSQAGLWKSTVDVELRIEEIFYDGIEGKFEPDEYVLIKNLGDYINLYGYTLQDESNKTYFFGNVDLEKNETVKIYTGCGLDSNNVLYWCYTQSAIWNNSGDTAFLRDDQGILIDSYSY